MTQTFANAKRILADITDLKKKEYSENRIYYYADDSDVTKGVGLVIGPEGTPYEDCPMLYEFNIQAAFPFEPPSVKFKTYDGITRFHPNMYVEGKCCLSILHTWDGPKWASTMRLSTILVTLQSLMDDAPLKHEPGYSSLKKDNMLVINYSKLVEHSCLRYTIKTIEEILDTSGKKLISSHMQPFVEIYKEYIPQILERLKKRLTILVEKDEVIWTGVPYSMNGKSIYGELLEKVHKLEKFYLV